MIELLETRIAPAGIFTYIDVDGDTVTVKTSRGTSQDLANIIVPYLSTEGVPNGQELQRIDFSMNPIFAATDLSVTAKRTNGAGDGLVNVGYIDATSVDGGNSLDLGNLKISGDLGYISAGDTTVTTPGVKSLTVGTIGRYGTDTQSGGAPSLDSFIRGAVGKLTVRGDVSGGTFVVSNGGFGTAADGKIGSIVIGGSLRGADTGGFTGFISASGDIKTLMVKHDIDAGNGIGQVAAGGKIGTTIIGGSIIGGAGVHSGRLQAGSFGSILVQGNLIGPSRTGVMTTNTAGSIESTGDIGSLTIKGSMLSGIDPYGSNITVGGNIATLTIGGSIVGDGYHTAGITVMGTLSSLNVHGSVVGGENSESSAHIEAGSFGKILIGGDVRGGKDAPFSGEITCTGAVGSIAIGGSLIGGEDSDVSNGNNEGRRSGSISLLACGSISIRGDVIGGTGNNTGQISANFTKTAKLFIGGSLIGGQAQNSGIISSTSLLAPVTIAGDVIGSNAYGSDVYDSGSIVAQGISSVTIGGSIISGRAITANAITHSGFIGAIDAIGSIVVKGSLLGNSDNAVAIVARGQATPGATDVAIGSLSVAGRVEHSLIAAGYSLIFRGLNADAQIGSVSVGGDWIASNILDGVDPGANGAGNANDQALVKGADYGSGPTKDDLAINSKISSIVIKGGVFGTPGVVNDSFGFVAQEIVSFKVGTTVIPLKPGVANDVFATSSAQPVGAGRSSITPDGFEVHVLEV